MPSRFCLKILSLITVIIALGCGVSRDTNATPLPAPNVARRAVEAAMENWKAGRPTGRIESGSPRIQVNDSFRKKGQVLDHYEILGNTTAESSLTFVLKVTLSNPDEVQTVRFVLLGIDPVLVFRQEDYELMSHWEHKMDPELSEPPS